MGFEGLDHCIESFDLGLDLFSLGLGQEFADFSVELDDLGLGLSPGLGELGNDFPLFEFDLLLLGLKLELLDGGFGIGQGRDLVGTGVDFVDCLGLEGLEPDFTFDIGNVVARNFVGTLSDRGGLGHTLGVRDDVWVGRGDDQVRIGSVVFLVDKGL